ncbi:MAG: hypothetical protein JSW46_01105 [Gemmatimonadota bacterium]|nr:MAG: hypothetical protein JSW46_01105 [Gemmatimonadota bacterium]
MRWLLLLGPGFGLTGLAVTVPLLALAVVVWTLGEISFMLGPAIGTAVYSVGPPLLWSGCFAMGALAGTRRPDTG